MTFDNFSIFYEPFSLVDWMRYAGCPDSSPAINAILDAIDGGARRPDLTIEIVHVGPANCPVALGEECTVYIRHGWAVATRPRLNRQISDC